MWAQLVSVSFRHHPNAATRQTARPSSRLTTKLWLRGRLSPAIDITGKEALSPTTNSTHHYHPLCKATRPLQPLLCCITRLALVMLQPKLRCCTACHSCSCWALAGDTAALLQLFLPFKPFCQCRRRDRVLSPLSYEHHESKLRVAAGAPAGAPWWSLGRKTVAAGRSPFRTQRERGGLWPTDK